MEKFSAKVIEQSQDTASISNSAESTANIDKSECFPDDVAVLIKPLLIESEFLFKRIYKQREKIDGHAIATRLSIF